MNGWIFATREEAQRCIDAIDTALGTDEDLRVGGRVVTRRRKTWAHPEPLRDGTFMVPRKPRLATVEDATVDVDGTPVRVPTADETVTVRSDERGDPDAPEGGER
jgi:hypothetical protein